MKFIRYIALLFVSFISLFITDEVRADGEWLVDELWSYGDDEVLSVAISEDGEYLVAGTSRDNPSGDGRVILFGNENNTPIWQYNTGDYDIGTIDISANGRYIVAGSTSSGSNSGIYLFDRYSNFPIWTYTTGWKINSIDISKDGNYIVAGSEDANVYVFGIESNEPLWIYGSQNGIDTVAISADGQYIVAGEVSNGYFFSKNSSTPLWTIYTGPRYVAISDNGEYSAFGSFSNDNLYVYNKEGTLLKYYDQGEYDIDSVSMSSDGRVIATTNSGGVLCVTSQDDEGNYSPSSETWCNDHGHGETPGVISANGEIIVTSPDGSNGGIYHWNSWMENRINYTSAYDTVNSIALSANGEYLIVGTESHIRFLRYKLPPVALIEDINRESLRFDSMITFTGSVIYNYGDFNIYEWNSSIDGLLSADLNFTTSYLSPGEHIISFRALSNDGRWSGWDSTTVVVHENKRPVSSIESIIAEGGQLLFEGSAEDGDGDISEYEWMSSLDGLLSNKSTFQTSVNLLTGGNHSIFFRAKDNDGLWGNYNSSEIYVVRDRDEDGINDEIDDFPDNSTEWKDNDGDGYGDNLADIFPNNPDEWQDADGDGYGDNLADAFPNNSEEWSDADQDGVGDNSDAFPNNRYQWSDSDNDGIGDGDDAFPYDPNEWEDWDGDGIGDNTDAFPKNYYEWKDSDGDGIGDNSDILINTPNNYIYIISVPIIIIIGTIAIELLSRDSLKNTQEKLIEFIDEGIENKNISSAKENTENLSGLVLFSSPLKEAKNLVTTTLKMKTEAIQALEKISLLRNNSSEMEKEKINVDDFNKEIDKIEKQLLKQTKKDFGEKYLKVIKKEALEKEEKK
tara:strand:+ start:1268 stop:3817 length:2550 start_codon:yes stop_codon:yes gene_type:complete